jgi:hypothetical protein
MRYSNLPALGNFIISICALLNKPPVRNHAGGSDWEGRAWPQLMRCAPYPSTCPKFLNEVQRTSNKVQLNSEGKATLMKVPIGLPEVAWESLDMISRLRELVRKHIQSTGTKSGHTSGNRKTT